ncbi:MAG TPA: hypothetical protein VED40_11275 [Azospirillaceae bacterium]|nr:hypothetical protein [Azospirillaceae bacterium]
MKKTFRTLVLSAAIAAASPGGAGGQAATAGGDAYAAAVELVTPEMLAECEQGAIRAIADQARFGAAIEWRDRMAPGEVGRSISSSWAERVGATQPGPGDAPPPDGFLAAVTGRAAVTPKAGPPMELIPVCWFEHQPKENSIRLFQVTLRSMRPGGP